MIDSNLSIPRFKKYQALVSLSTSEIRVVDIDTSSKAEQFLVWDESMEWSVWGPIVDSEQTAIDLARHRVDKFKKLWDPQILPLMGECH